MAQFPCLYLKGDVELTVERERHIAERRHWIVTAYFARRLAEGETEWQRN
jgi:hypothetical protein